MKQPPRPAFACVLAVAMQLAVWCSSSLCPTTAAARPIDTGLMNGSSLDDATYLRIRRAGASYVKIGLHWAA
ncbi:MAG: hypothetical protein M3304_07525, partial [Actinomycetota bacterium]|nr:hypothetical protein [Actinomycetota bacterium]